METAMETGQRDPKRADRHWTKRKIEKEDKKCVHNNSDEVTRNDGEDGSLVGRSTVHLRLPAADWATLIKMHDNATLKYLFDLLCALHPDFDWDKGKALVEKRPKGLTHSGDRPKAMLKFGEDNDLPLKPYHGCLLRFLVPKKLAIENLQAASNAVHRANESGQARRLAIPAARPQRISAPGSTYTFGKLAPLPYLPSPERSMAFLARLKADWGIRAAMEEHKLNVGLLTEMDPSAHTQSTHEGISRILGLNRNHGEVIELRLRTDAYDGYRDYKTIRNTLCHELAHNVHGPHDRNFWNLCHQIERQVMRINGGRIVSDVEFAPSREDNTVDGGGWHGGEHVLGRGTTGGEAADNTGLSSSEIRFRAALKRIEPKREDGPSGEGGSAGQ